MWNLTVAVDHTFFVGQGRWWVHNACGEAALVTFASKADAKAASGIASNRAASQFFAKADSQARDFRMITLPNGSVQLEYFSPARNEGFGKQDAAVFDGSWNLVDRVNRSLTFGDGFTMITKETHY